MRPMIFAILFMFTITSARAADELIGTSPDGRFAFLKGKDAVQLVALPSRKILIPGLFQENIGEKPTILWSQDGSRVAFCTDCCRFNRCEAFQRRNGSFSKLILPELQLPSSIDVNDVKSQHDKPEQWKDGKLLLVTDGFGGGVQYSYGYTIAFDQSGKGKVVSVEKKNYKVVK